MTTQIHRITPDCQPVFPCWLWHEGTWRWIRHEAFPHHDLLHNAYTHWHPDQPSAPTATPPTNQATAGEINAPTTEAWMKRIATAAPAVAQGETPRIYEACLNWDNTGDYRKRLVSVEYYEQLKRELNEAKTLYAAALDTLKDMSAQVAQLTGAQDRMDAEIAMLTADLFRATRERDQARQDLEERRAENDRERAAHLQAYQEACKERDEARASYRARDNIGMSREEYHKAKKALEENETLRVHLASERQAKIERGDMFIELQAQYATVESELAELRKDHLSVAKEAAALLEAIGTGFQAHQCDRLRQAIHDAVRNQQENRE